MRADGIAREAETESMDGVAELADLFAAGLLHEEAAVVARVKKAVKHFTKSMDKNFERRVCHTAGAAFRLHTVRKSFCNGPIASALYSTLVFVPS